MDNHTDLLLYQTEDGKTKIDVKLENGTVWMTQKAIAELYQTTPQNITLHIKNIYEEGELSLESTCKEYLQVQIEGKREIKRSTKHYNLELIIAIGYRVRSHRGTQFRRWATERLNEYLVKGFTMDDERLKDMRHFGQDYFDELLQRIRDIRASEKRFYRKITDIYATSVDYDPNASMSKEFFATVQMYMKDWIDKLNSFLKFNEREILTNAGKISQEVAEKLAIAEYEKYNQHRLAIDDESDDFDEFVKNNQLDKR